LSWNEGPLGTQSIALIVDDPDAPDPRHPKTRWVHWVLFDLSANTRSLPEGVRHLPEGTGQGLNDSQRVATVAPVRPPVVIATFSACTRSIARSSA
jgi:phosphatidylethanolamine-binding protein (PEBP) family uncharacterized protein